MQTKINSSVEAMLRMYYKLNILEKNEMITAIILSYPDYYQEFIEKMDKKVYEKYVVKA